jgi:large subunit ribosomal protein L22
MLYRAVAKNIPYSPYKLRPIANVIRNKSVSYALAWLENIYRNKKVVSIKKTLESALSNALLANKIDTGLRSGEFVENMVISEIKIDQGLIRKYFKPGAQGRSTILRRRFCHISIALSSKVDNKKAKNNKDNKEGVLSGTKG